MGTYKGEEGCLFESGYGRHNIARVIELALDYGMPMEDQDAEHWAKKDDEPDSEYMIEWSEHAEEWLNENVANDGYQFEWNDGEFFYVQSGQWDE